MAQQTAIQNTATQLLAIITDSDDQPVTGLTYSDVGVQFAKAGEVVFTSKSLSESSDFVHVGNGVYLVQFSEDDVDTVGNFIYQVTSSGNPQYIGTAYVVAAEATIITATLDTCVLYDVIFGLDTNPAVGISVIAKLTGTPLVQNSIGITRDGIVVKTDSNGQFYLTLPRGAVVSISIPAMNYSRTLTVPNSDSKRLFELV